MNFKNKLIIISLLLFIILLLFLNNNVFAFEYESEHFFELIGSSGICWRICSDRDFYILPEYVGGSYWMSSYSLETNEPCNITLYRNGTKYYDDDLNHAFLGAITTDKIPSVFNYSGNVVIYAINTNTGENEIFFQTPPQIVEGITIPALETADQIPQAIVTTLKILIPVGLIVLSIGLVVYLIKRVKYSIM